MRISDWSSDVCSSDLLEESGVIARRVTILDASALGLDLTVFVSLRASEHSEAWLDTLNSAIRDIPEVVEFYRMTGDVDYLLKLRVENMAAYEIGRAHV